MTGSLHGCPCVNPARIVATYRMLPSVSSFLFACQSNGKPGRCEKQVFFKGAGDGPQSYIHMDRVAQFPLTSKDLVVRSVKRHENGCIHKDRVTQLPLTSMDVVVCHHCQRLL